MPFRLWRWGPGAGPKGFFSWPLNAREGVQVDTRTPKGTMAAMKTVLAILALGTAGAAAAATPVETILDGISAERIESHIRKLAAFGTRNTLSETESPTRGIGAARRWIHDELRRCGGERLRVEYDEHLVESGPRIPKPTKVVNVVATLPGSQPESRERIYVVSRSEEHTSELQ